ncbi:hypothetical protein N7509_001336 [Penicillium cosmopolitanum]|uniref:Uncharacterized protein n=1 Tax=Penicillium cosmopolitanum TaxID=1131564 RepID=A0A9X0BF30_9EURO|nr:uncharacterized protein N7509_001336 [Penicillium cosmopolitanum]KAJ5414709.1 hypothetical protein N7509_001336 [Penicillium cosmopolitanum]
MDTGDPPQVSAASEGAGNMPPPARIRSGLVEDEDNGEINLRYGANSLIPGPVGGPANAPSPAQHILLGPFQTPADQHHDPPFGLSPREVNERDAEAKSVAFILYRCHSATQNGCPRSQNLSLSRFPPLSRHANILRIFPLPARIRRRQLSAFGDLPEFWLGAEFCGAWSRIDLQNRNLDPVWLSDRSLTSQARKNQNV